LADAIVIDLGREIFGARRYYRRPLPEHCSTSAAALWSISSQRVAFGTVPRSTGHADCPDCSLCAEGGRYQR
jgi:hypothetical protein